MKNEMCFFCRDKKNYEQKVQEARRINCRLKTFLANKINNKNDMIFERNNENICLYKKFEVFDSHVHFMCGQCSNVNNMELKKTEREINQTLSNLVCILTREDKEYHETLRLLQGFYSGKYNVFQKEILKK